MIWSASSSFFSLSFPISESLKKKDVQRVDFAYIYFAFILFNSFLKRQWFFFYFLLFLFHSVKHIACTIVTLHMFYQNCSIVFSGTDSVCYFSNLFVHLYSLYGIVYFFLASTDWFIVFKRSLIDVSMFCINLYRVLW